MRLDRHHRGTGRRPGYVLIVVLVVIVVLSLAAYRYSDMMISESRATMRILKNSEAKALADSGIHYAAAVVADPNALQNVAGNNPFNNDSAFKDKSPYADDDGKKGHFSIVAVDYSQTTGSGETMTRYGVTDESAKLNLNALVALDPSANGIAYKTLMLLPNMTDDVAYAIIDWIDADDNTSPNGAEDSYYMSLSPSYHCKNGPLDSVEELLLVKGVTAALLYGDDLNRNGVRDADESASSGTFNLGWAPYLTVYSREANVASDGTPRVNVNGKDLKQLYSDLQTAVGNDLAAYVLAYRIYGPTTDTPANATAGSASDLATLVQKATDGGTANAKQSVSSLLALIGTKVVIPSQQRDQPSAVYPFPANDPGKAADLLPKLLDKATTKADKLLPGKVNVNTAPQAVLLCLPGLEQDDIDKITSGQAQAVGSTDLAYQTVAWLYTTAGLTPQKLQALEQYVTARTQVYRIQSVGYFPKGGPVARVEAVVDVNNGKPRFLYYRDLSDIGRSLDPRAKNN
jgi:type II secretory pathway component PulK